MAPPANRSRSTEAPLPLRYTDNLVYAEISQRDRILALWVAGVAVILTVASVPIARLPVGEIVSFLPAVYAVAIFAELLTAFLLWNQYRASGHPPIAILALAYVGTAVLGSEYVVTFPHAFAEHFLGAGSQTAIWLYFVGHVFFATYIILFAVWEPLCRRIPTFARGNG